MNILPVPQELTLTRKKTKKYFQEQHGIFVVVCRKIVVRSFVAIFNNKKQ